MGTQITCLGEWDFHWRILLLPNIPQCQYEGLGTNIKRKYKNTFSRLYGWQATYTSIISIEPHCKERLERVKWFAQCHLARQRESAFEANSSDPGLICFLDLALPSIKQADYQGMKKIFPLSLAAEGSTWKRLVQLAKYSKLFTYPNLPRSTL